MEGLTPGESDDEGGQRNPREPHANTGSTLEATHVRSESKLNVQKYVVFSPIIIKTVSLL